MATTSASSSDGPVHERERPAWCTIPRCDLDDAPFQMRRQKRVIIAHGARRGAGEQHSGGGHSCGTGLRLSVSKSVLGSGSERVLQFQVTLAERVCVYLSVNLFWDPAPRGCYNSK